MRKTVKCTTYLRRQHFRPSLAIKQRRLHFFSQLLMRHHPFLINDRGHLIDKVLAHVGGRCARSKTHRGELGIILEGEHCCDGG